MLVALVLRHLPLPLWVLLYLNLLGYVVSRVFYS